MIDECVCVQWERERAELEMQREVMLERITQSLTAAADSHSVHVSVTSVSEGDAVSAITHHITDLQVGGVVCFLNWHPPFSPCSPCCHAVCAPHASESEL